MFNSQALPLVTAKQCELLVYYHKNKENTERKLGILILMDVKSVIRPVFLFCHYQSFLTTTQGSLIAGIRFYYLLSHNPNHFRFRNFDYTHLNYLCWNHHIILSFEPRCHLRMMAYIITYRRHILVLIQAHIIGKCHVCKQHMAYCIRICINRTSYLDPPLHHHIPHHQLRDHLHIWACNGPSKGTILKHILYRALFHTDSTRLRINIYIQNIHQIKLNFHHRIPQYLQLLGHRKLVNSDRTHLATNKKGSQHSFPLCISNTLLYALKA